ncbi:carbohydrate esterase family 1 protein [Whalleya microplaca]|nr:carbohydrate esterase family 1 protein [Whalleya microplaca]
MYWIPPNYDSNTPAPLILSFHGAGRSPDWQADVDRLTDPVFNTDHILVYPASTTSNGTWQGAPGVPARVDDIGYVLQVLDAVQAALCVDAGRVYATGKSQGGMLTNLLACSAHASARIAAFAPVSGSYYIPPPFTPTNPFVCDPATVPIPSCAPARHHVPILAFHGGNDTTIAFAGGPRNGECLPAVRHWIEAWAARDGLRTDVKPVKRILTSAASVYEYGGDGGKSEKGLVSFVYDGDHVNHDWPATVPNLDNIENGDGPASFNASRLIMEFFSRHTLS